MRRHDLLDLHDALQHPGQVTAVDLQTEFEDEEDLDLVTPVDGFLECVSTGSALLITGEFKTRCVQDCARCAGPIEVDVEFQIEEEFPVEGTPACYGNDDFARVMPTDEPEPMFEGNQLMVERLLRQGLWLNMPVQSLCEFGWDGPCPKATDYHNNTEDEHPFAKLEKLKEAE